MWTNGCGRPFPERCLCGAPDCKSCGPAQGYPLHYRLCPECDAELEWDHVEEQHRPCEACAKAKLCPECGGEVGPDGWCPDCGDGLSCDEHDDTGGDPDPELTKEGV
jgi:hypothetical protein